MLGYGGYKNAKGIMIICWQKAADAVNSPSKALALLLEKEVETEEGRCGSLCFYSSYIFAATADNYGGLQHGKLYWQA